MDSKPKIKVSEHAMNRLHERCGIPKKAAMKLAISAYDKGLKHGELPGRLFKWVLSSANTSSKGSAFRVYGDKLFIFSPDNKDKESMTLVTVFQIPSNLTNLVKVSYEKKNKGHMGE